MRMVTDGRMNPDRCTVPTTWFTTQARTVCSLVSRRHARRQQGGTRRDAPDPPGDLSVFAWTAPPRTHAPLRHPGCRPSCWQTRTTRLPRTQHTTPSSTSHSLETTSVRLTQGALQDFGAGRPARPPCCPRPDHQALTAATHAPPPTRPPYPTPTLCRGAGGRAHLPAGHLQHQE
jgi:hypothetical protein